MTSLLTDEALEQIEELLAELGEKASEGTPIIVEGMDDVNALKRLGIGGSVHKISNGSPLLNFVEGFSGFKEIIVLTDFDRAGDELASFIARQGKSLGVNPITDFREKLKQLVRREVKDIEGLAKFLQRERSLKRG